MAVTLPDLRSLDPSEVEQFRQLATQLVAEYNPGVDLKRGPVQDLVLTIKAALDTALQTQIDLIRQSSSLAQLAANPSLADPVTVANLLSNYGLSQGQGSPAIGTVLIVLSSLVPTVIPVSTVFTIGGQSYQPTQTIAGRTQASQVVSSADVLIVPLGANFALPVPVTASQAGSAGNVKAGTTATLSQNPPAFVAAYAQADFSGGSDPQSVAQLVALQQSGLAVKAWSSRTTIDALLRSLVSGLVADSVIGYGDLEMTRDQHALWPGSLGGRTDVYVRTAPLWQTVALTKTATLVSASGAVGTWQVSIGRDDAPGFYEALGVLLPSQAPGSTGFAVTSDVRGTDLSIDASHSYFPDIQSTLESGYSRYQTATLQFVDTVTNASGLTPGQASAFTYTVLLKAMPSVALLQDTLGQRPSRPSMGDVLLKAAVPCFVTVSFTLNIPLGATVTVSAIQNAVAAAVNAVGFTGQLPASLVSQAVHNLLGSTVVSLTGMLLTGRVRRPDGIMVSLSDPANLALTNDPTHLTTALTVAFLLTPADVTVTVVNLAAPG